MPPEIEANRVLPVLRQLKDALITTEDRSIFISGRWGLEKHKYTRFVQNCPVTDVGFHRERAPGFWKILRPLLGYNFVLKLEDPAFLVNIFQMFPDGRSVSAWSVGDAEAEDFKTELLAQSLGPGGSNTHIGCGLVRFAPNLFWFDFFEEIGDDCLCLWLHCGERVPHALKQIISDNNLESYIEEAAKH